MRHRRCNHSLTTPYTPVKLRSVSHGILKSSEQTGNHGETTYECLNVSQEVDGHNMKNVGEEQEFNLQHPFSMIASGPTVCGKTTFVKNILLQGKIEPWLQRIVWLFKHWQSAYDVVKFAVDVEFIQGITLSLDFETNIRNLCVIDDLISEIAKDSRITHLFTEGSHHCNCQYLALWNSPADKSPIMSVAQ